MRMTLPRRLAALLAPLILMAVASAAWAIDFQLRRPSPGVEENAHPRLLNVTGPASGTYGTNDTLDFTVTWDLPVAAPSAPRLILNIGGQTRYATYHSGNGTNSLIFRYTITSGENDADGIVLADNIDTSTGGVFHATYRTVSAGTAFSAPSTSAVLVQTALADCLAWYNAGATTDGAYLIDPDGAGPVAAANHTCLMSEDGGGWTYVGNYGAGAGSYNDITPPNFVFNQIKWKRTSGGIALGGGFGYDTATIILFWPAGQYSANSYYNGFIGPSGAPRTNQVVRLGDCERLCLCGTCGGYGDNFGAIYVDLWVR